ncbi:MAG: indole-3-glycerol phosphate synthase TrpC [Tannerellaceae bacterium]|jgi:indole-3-glycerol phosphate synthase|nr:indole-3-glycerol phosphate synthase TrpC [Tannerellaceae bacterium]
MTDILQEIVANKRIEVAEEKKNLPLSTLREWAGSHLSRRPRSMRRALSHALRDGSLPSGIIAEFKRRSPSKGLLYRGAEVTEVVPAYEYGGASVCSILTDEKFFGGSLRDLERARQCVKLPLLRKDFIIDEYQVFRSRISGADAILLIASVLSKEECRRLSELATFLQLEVLLELHDEKELDYINPFVDMVGVNNRHLGTFHTDVATSFRLSETLRNVLTGEAFSPETSEAIGRPLLVAESGIDSPETVRSLRAAGFGGFLIGEAFMKAKDPGEALKTFVEALR